MSLKDYLESLEIGGEKLSKEQIKEALAENGKVVTTEVDKVKADMQKENDDLKATISSLKEQVEKAPKTDEMENLKNQIADYEKKEQERIETEKAKALEETINKNILEAISDKEFVNERTKNSIINEVKTALMDKANTGKSAKDIFEGIVKDTTDILKNPNETKYDMPEMKDVGDKPATEGIKFNPLFQNFN